MSALGSNSLGTSSRLFSGRDSRARTAKGRRIRPNVERLERIFLLATGCPVISGFVYLDQNRNPALTNNGHLDPGELPIPNAQVQLFDANNRLIATTRTDSRGAYSFDGVPNTNGQPVTLPTQNVLLPPTLTNFSNQPFGGPIQLFDPELGTLTGVTITRSASLSSSITTQNLSPSSPAQITLGLNGTYQINGLGQSISGTASTSQGPITSAAFDPNNPNANRIGPVVLSSTDSPPATTLTSAADLAFFTARGNRTSILPTMSATGFGTASSDTGGLDTEVVTSASGIVSVTYTYIPKICFAPGRYRLVQTPNPGQVINGKTSQPGVVFPAPPAGQPQQLLVNVTTFDRPRNDFAKLVPPTPPPDCPTPGKLVRFGVHHQQTRLVLSFIGPVDPAIASNPRNYVVIARNGARIPIVSATFDPATNSVTLIPARRLRLHARYDLSVNLPCDGPCTNVVIPFGGKASLGGFQNHQGGLVRVVNGRIIRPGR